MLRNLLLGHLLLKDVLLGELSLQDLRLLESRLVTLCWPQMLAVDVTLLAANAIIQTIVSQNELNR